MAEPEIEETAETSDAPSVEEGAADLPTEEPSGEGEGTEAATSADSQATSEQEGAADPPLAEVSASDEAPKSSEDKETSVKKQRKIQMPEFSGRFRSANFSPVGLITALWSKDASTRKMGLLFFLSLVTLFGTSVRGFRYFYEIRKAEHERIESARLEQVKIAEERQHELQRIKEGRVDIGKFMIPLRSEAGRGPANLVRNIAELDITLECDRQKACQYVADRIPEVRDLINQELLPIEREYFYSRSGKQTIKDRIKRALNDWLPYGLIRQVYFPVLLIN